ncbi:hypothetical protein [Nonomuraea turkmeniaca]|uniref:hypothetical protein n=1 Tax=Nonomuraea turkmeniaca TaxID=103838 RepID=UPI001B874EE3|nr:hypothetical protein [Nonomuraea turkmeniaca]
MFAIVFFSFLIVSRSRTSTSGVAPRARQRQSRWRWWVVAALAVMALTGLLVFLLADVPLWGRLLAFAVAVPLLARAGRPTDKPITDRVSTGPRYRKLTAELVRRGLLSCGISRAVLGELQRVASSPPHGHNNALYLASVALGQLVAGGELTAAAVTSWLTEAATQIGQPYREAQRTIASGLRAGARRPRKVAA